MALYFALWGPLRPAPTQPSAPRVFLSLPECESELTYILPSANLTWAGPLT